MSFYNAGVRSEQSSVKMVAMLMYVVYSTYQRLLWAMRPDLQLLLDLLPDFFDLLDELAPCEVEAPSCFFLFYWVISHELGSPGPNSIHRYLMNK